MRYGAGGSIKILPLLLAPRVTSQAQGSGSFAVGQDERFGIAKIAGIEN
jgi:hypothetical protein